MDVGKILIKKKKYTLCNLTIGDEYHFLLACTSLSHNREILLPKYFCANPSIEKCVHLMKYNYYPILQVTSDKILFALLFYDTGLIRILVGKSFVDKWVFVHIFT